MRNRGAVLNRALGLAVAGLLVLLVGCGGGKKAPTLVIATTTILDGEIGIFYSQSFTSTGGTPPVTWSVASGVLPGGLTLNPAGVLSGTPTTAGDFTITLQARDSGTKKNAQTATQSYTFDITDTGSLVIETSVLPPTSVASGSQTGNYSAALVVSANATGSVTWTVSAGALPAGMNLSTSGVISGQATGPAAIANFTVQVVDSIGDSGQRALSISVSTALGRNDTIASATRLSNGTFEATISIPVGDAGTAVSPDHDVYLIPATGGNVVSIEIFAKRFVSPNRLDSVIEITDATGTRLTTCRNLGNDDGVTGAPDPTPLAFDDICLNDDIVLGVIQDSFLELLVPFQSDPAIYVRVLDWNGTGRPDSRYQIVVSGAD